MGTSSGARGGSRAPRRASPTPKASGASTREYDSFPLMMAAATFVILPVLIAFLPTERFFTRSIVLGGFK